MFCLVPTLTARLATALGPAWQVSDGTRHHDRRQLPRAEVRLSGAALGSTSGPGVTLQLRYAVLLCVNSQTGDFTQPDTTAFAQLEQAVTAAIAQLHHWRPDGQQARLTLQSFAEADLLDQSLFGYELAFTLTTTRMGHNA